jgi:16S rRNA pseudouridine516 synthase
MQLERILQSQGFGSRKACRALIRAGAVRIAGETCTDPFAEFAEHDLGFSVHDHPWRYRATVHLMLNKPEGYECSRAPKHHPGILGLLPEPLVLRGVQPVGRLDADTTGLLLLSDDGPFIHRLTSPRHAIGKVYEVGTKHPIDDAQIIALRAGVTLRDDPAPVAALACVRLGENRLRLTLGEGKYHQVKRMLAAVGNRVESLRRTAIGGLALPGDLTPGAWRWLEAEDLQRLERPGPLEPLA